MNGARSSWPSDVKSKCKNKQMLGEFLKHFKLSQIQYLFSHMFTSKTRSLLDKGVSSACRVTLISLRCASPGSPRWSCASRSGSTPWTRSSVVWCGTASASSSETIQPWVNLSYFNLMLMRSQMHNLRVVWKNPATIVGELGTMVVVLIIGMLLPTFCKSSWTKHGLSK